MIHNTKYGSIQSILSKNRLIISGTGLLTLYQAIPFNDLEKKPFENNVGKGENAGNQHFLLFPTMFSTLPSINFSFLVTLMLPYANDFNFDQSKILSFGKRVKKDQLLQKASTTVSQCRLIMIDTFCTCIRMLHIEQG